MIRINLLPFRAARKKENVRKQLSIFFLSLVLVSIIAFAYNVMLGNKIDRMKRKIEDTKTQLAKYNKINKEIQEIKDKLATLNKKIDVIKTLDLNRKEPVQLLQTMSDLIIPNRMWLTKFTTDNSSITLVGIAVDQPTVADYMTRIEDSDQYESVKLSSIKPANIGQKDLNLKTFGLSFNKTQPGKPEEKAKKK